MKVVAGERKKRHEILDTHSRRPTFRAPTPTFSRVGAPHWAAVRVHCVSWLFPGCFQVVLGCFWSRVFLAEMWIKSKLITPKLAELKLTEVNIGRSRVHPFSASSCANPCQWNPCSPTFKTREVSRTGNRPDLPRSSWGRHAVPLTPSHFSHHSSYNGTSSPKCRRRWSPPPRSQRRTPSPAPSLGTKELGTSGWPSPLSFPALASRSAARMASLGRVSAIHGFRHHVRLSSLAGLRVCTHGHVCIVVQVLSCIHTVLSVFLMCVLPCSFSLCSFLIFRVSCSLPFSSLSLFSFCLVFSRFCLASV